VFKKGIVAGATDVPLSRAGIAQMEAVAAFLADKPLQIVYSSPLRRAAEPAAELAAARKIVHSEVMDLAEIDFGDWEGKSYEQLAKDDPDTVAKAKAASALFTFPNGENIEFFRRRVQVAFAQLVRTTSGPSAIYAHGGSIRMILAAVQAITPAQAQKIDLSPGGISIIDPDGSGFKVSALNLIDHLPNQNESDVTQAPEIRH
jgi:broad specificity phosphatase PhoE